jgi:hypothetical protein
MTYSVTWKMTAIRQLTEVLSAAADPERVRQAAERMEFMLRRYPNDMGESRSPGFRVWYEDVLVVYYHINEDSLRVDVLLAGPARRR